MDVRPRLARQADRLGRLARAHRADAAPLHAGGRAHRPVVPRLGRRARRRADAARARVPGDRRRDLRRGLHADRPHAGSARARPARSARAAGSCCARVLHERESRSPVSAPAAWAAASRSCSPMRDTRSRWSISSRATRRRSRKLSRRGARAKCATCWRRSRASACSIRRMSTRIAGARLGRAGAEMRRPRSRRPASSSKACRKCSTSSARRWRAPRRSPGRSRSSPRPPRPSWSTISAGAVAHPRALPQRALAQSGLSWCRWSSSRPASTPIRP